MGVLCSFKDGNIVTKNALVNQLWPRFLGWMKGCEILSWDGTGMGCVPRNPDPTAASRICSLSFISGPDWLPLGSLWCLSPKDTGDLTGPALVQKNQKTFGSFYPRNEALVEKRPAGVSVNSRG